MYMEEDTYTCMWHTYAAAFFHTSSKVYVPVVSVCTATCLLAGRLGYQNTRPSTSTNTIRALCFVMKECTNTFSTYSPSTSTNNIRALTFQNFAAHRTPGRLPGVRCAGKICSRPGTNPSLSLIHNLALSLSLIHNLALSLSAPYIYMYMEEDTYTCMWHTYAAAFFHTSSKVYVPVVKNILSLTIFNILNFQ